MSDLFQKILGVLLAGIFLALGLLPISGSFFVGSPVFFIAPLRWSFPVISTGFLGMYLPGLLIGRIIFHQYFGNWVVPEGLALLFLFWVPDVMEKRYENSKSIFDHQYKEQKENFDSFKQDAEKLKRENNQIEKQLKQIEHLYDVVKEAGGTLNVQEMIELTKEFAERMFDLPHFIIAVLSNDAKKFEIRFASSCDESFFRSFDLDLDSSGLAAVLSKEKKPIWIDSVENEPRFSKLKHLAIKSFVFLPFLVQERVIGFLCSYFSPG